MKFGIGYITLEDGEYKGPIAKFLTEEQKASLKGDKGDTYVLTNADKEEIAEIALATLINAEEVSY